MSFLSLISEQGEPDVIMLVCHVPIPQYTNGSIDLDNDDDDVIKGPWTCEEDALLRKLLGGEGDRSLSWKQVALHVPGRGSRSCRLRWNNYLNPKVW
jgi:hypothetical protein